MEYTPAGVCVSSSLGLLVHCLGLVYTPFYYLGVSKTLTVSCENMQASNPTPDRLAAPCLFGWRLYTKPINKLG